MSTQRGNKNSDAIRILQRDRDASARATHLKAEIGMVPNSTIERKIMSTKTSIKRIALVAAAALTLGGFSAVSANAAAATTATPFYVSAADSASLATDGTATAATETANGVAGPYNYVTLTAASSLVSGATLGIAVSGVNGALSITHQGATAGTDTLTVSGNTVTSNTNAINTAVVKILTPTVGSFTVTVSKNVDTNGQVATTTLQTITFTVAAASVVGTVSAANSTSYIQTTALGTKTFAGVNALTVSADSTTVLAKTASTTPVAFIKVTLKDTQATPAVIGSTLLSATVSGSALVSGTNTSGAAQSSAIARVATAYTDTTTGVTFFEVYGDGTAGTGTITIAAGTTVVSTETITFYSTTAATATIAKQNLFILNKAGGTLGSATSSDSGTTVAKTKALIISLKDSAGNSVGGQAAYLTASSSDSTILSSTINAVEDTDSTYGLGAGNYIIQPTAAASSTTGKTATLTVKWTSPTDSTVIVSAPAATFTVGSGTVATVTITPVAATYNVSDLATFTLSAKDSSGNPVADGNYKIFGSTFTGLTTSAQLTSSLFSYSTSEPVKYVQVINGVATSTAYIPYATQLVVSGVVGTDAALATAIQGTTVSSTVAINSANDSSSLAYDAASAATDAANNAYEEAQNATQAASDALAAVKALAVQVKALIALVNKIKAKLKA